MKLTKVKARVRARLTSMKTKLALWHLVRFSKLQEKDVKKVVKDMRIHNVGVY